MRCMAPRKRVMFDYTGCSTLLFELSAPMRTSSTLGIETFKPSKLHIHPHISQWNLTFHKTFIYFLTEGRSAMLMHHESSDFAETEQM